MTRRFLSFLILMPVLVLGREEILLFHSDITIHKDARVVVKETIEVSCEHKQIKRGIVREFPTIYSNGLFSQYRVPFKILRVTHNGELSPYFIKQADNGKCIYIGSRDQLIPLGKHVYTIEYETQRQIAFFDQWDELYWNVTGNGWRLPIVKATATVHLPTGILREDIKGIGYTGFYGQRGSAYTYQIQDTIVSFSTTKVLSPGQGFTIAVGIPKGFINQPTLIQKFIWFVRDNILWLNILVLLLILMIGMFFVWYKNRIRGIIIPRFYPPKDMQPSEVGYLTFGQYKPILLAADILQLAVKGYITITYKNSDCYVLEKTSKPYEELSGYQAGILNALFDKESSIKIQDSVYNSKVNKAKELCEKAFPIKYFEKTVLIKICMSIGMVLLPSYFLYNQNEPWIFITVISFIVVGYVSKYFFTRTDKAQKLYEEIVGFELYLKTAELDRMNMVGTPPIRTPELYEEYLPYAIALGVERAWTKSFAPLFKEMEIKGHAYNPYWYSGSRIYRANQFGQTFAKSFTSSIVSSMYHPASSSSRSSGFGGGGGSGRGGGGGGGGGW